MNNILQLPEFTNTINKSNLSFDNYSFNEKKTNDNYTHSNELDMASKLEELDFNFLNSDYRKQNYYVKQIRSRTVVNTIGTITFNRRQYQSKHDNSYYYFIDDILDLMPHKRLSWALITEVLKKVTTDSYQRVADDLKISKGSVYNIIKSLRDKIIVSPLNEKKSIGILYVQADECYVKLQKKYAGRKTNTIMLEQITVHEGLRNVCKGRNELVNRRLYTRAAAESREEFYDRVNEDLLAMYDYKDIYLYGDGANWIKSAADALGATYITDLFHTMQAVNRLTTDDAWRIELTKAILSNKKFIFEVFKKQELLKNKPSKLRLNSYKYLMNHWNTIQLNFTKSKSIGCSQEGINSHYYASRLTSRPKGFHEASARVIAQLVNIKHNDEDFELEIHDQIIKPIMKQVRRKQREYDNTYIPNQASFSITPSKTLNFNRISHPYVI